MTIKLIFVFFLVASIGLICIISIGYWAVGHFVKQISDRALLQFRQQLAHETDLALTLFKEGVSEQIVHQENKSDSMGKLYATLIDLLRVGKEFSTQLAKGDILQAEKMLVGIRNSGESFAETFEKQRLHLPDELCASFDAFVVEQKGVVQQMEGNWRQARKDPSESKMLDSALKMTWARFEDSVTKLMESMRSEFRKRQPSQANVVMKWLNQVPVRKEAAPASEAPPPG